MQRPNNRRANQLRDIHFQRQFTRYAEGSVLVAFGHTQVICTASVEKGVPRFLHDRGQGWITAEYSMLPRATHTRGSREAARGKQTGRTVEIQRLIGRSLRSAVDLKALGEHTITVDCDVLQADGGTRTAAITGACVALADALNHLVDKKALAASPLKHMVAAISVGIFQGQPILDLEYTEDSQCDTDMNIVMTEQMEFIEVQGTAEGTPFNREQFDQMLQLAENGIQQITALQRQALATTKEHIT